ncbi:MAG: hydrogenase iron-sulfur subunit [Thermoplasmata archaeon]
MEAKGIERMEGAEDDFEPRIVAFCCNYCAYAAADLAGSMRLSYPSNVKVIRLPCSGKVEITYLLKALEDGADGVMVAGCLEGDCHFMEGNYRAMRKVNHTKRLLEEIGFESDRLEMFNLSSAMASRFAEIVEEMTERIRNLGPSPLMKKVKS